MTGEPKKKLGRPYNTEVLMTELNRLGYRIYKSAGPWGGYQLVYQKRCAVCGSLTHPRTVSPRFALKRDLTDWIDKNKKKLGNRIK